MPRLKPDTIRARQEHILDAAEICFARAGFHRTTMQEIAKEADISLGAIYVYFDSKEALIEGLAERDRQMLSVDLAAFAEASDLLEGLQRLGETYAVERPRHKQILHIEIGAESTRNEDIGRIFRSVDRFCKEGFERALTLAVKDGRIAPIADPKTIALIMSLIGDGMFWRGAVDPEFKAQEVLPVLSDMIGNLIRPTDMSTTADRSGTNSLEPEMDPLARTADHDRPTDHEGRT